MVLLTRWPPALVDVTRKTALTLAAALGRSLTVIVLVLPAAIDPARALKPMPLPLTLTLTPVAGARPLLVIRSV